MEEHRNRLQKLCHICGKNIPRGGKCWEKRKKKELILPYYDINIEEDNDDIHPPTICNRCLACMSRIEAAHGRVRYTPDTQKPVLCAMLPLPGGDPKRQQRTGAVHQERQPTT